MLVYIKFISIISLMPSLNNMLAEYLDHTLCFLDGFGGFETAGIEGTAALEFVAGVGAGAEEGWLVAYVVVSTLKTLDRALRTDL